MRPYNEDRVIIEYARIHRLVDLTLFEQEPTFADDLSTVFESATKPGLWFGHEWFLGNVETSRDMNESVTSISAQFGWSADTPSPEVPPAFDPASRTWADEPGQIHTGALAVLAIAAESQWMAITSKAGDVSVSGVCHALESLLNKTEADLARADREWAVEPIVERGSFQNWLRRVSKVTRVRASFHLPNPKTEPDIAAAVEYLNQLRAKRGTLEAANDDGIIDPNGHPLMQSAITMQENAYGTINADGETPDGKESPFSSRLHPARDTYRLDPQDPVLSWRGIIVVLLNQLAERVQRGSR